MEKGKREIGVSAHDKAHLSREPLRKGAKGVAPVGVVREVKGVEGVGLKGEELQGVDGEVEKRKTAAMAAGGAALAGGSLSEEELRVPLLFAVSLAVHRSGGFVEGSEIERRRLLGAGGAKKKGKKKKQSFSSFF